VDKFVLVVDQAVELLDVGIKALWLELAEFLPVIGAIELAELVPPDMLQPEVESLTVIASAHFGSIASCVPLSRAEISSTGSLKPAGRRVTPLCLQTRSCPAPQNQQGPVSDGGVANEVPWLDRLGRQSSFNPIHGGNCVLLLIV
jgi:hypothetical protein